MNAARCFMPMINKDGVICDDEDNNSASTNSSDGNANTSFDEEDFEILNIGPNETNIFLMKEQKLLRTTIWWKMTLIMFIRKNNCNVENIKQRIYMESMDQMISLQRSKLCE